MKAIPSLFSILVLMLLLSSASCGSATRQAQSADSISEPSRTAAPFDADTALRYIREQVAFGVRTPGSEGHKACASWIESKLRDWGYTVTLQHFTGKDYFGKEVQGTNIIATLQPEHEERILLMAHWDTRQVADHDPVASRQQDPILGADDGASGVAVLLELARQEALKPSGKALDFVFFDLEDGGGSQSEDSWCLGSQYWAKHPHRPGYSAQWGILLDMVGAHGARFYWEGLSKEYARPLLATLWQTAAQLGWGNYFVQADGSQMTDDHVAVVRELGIPSVDIINFDPTRPTGFGAHWHTTADDMNIISRETLRAVGETVATTVREDL